MSEIILTDEILTDEESSSEILLDEVARGKKGQKGDKGDPGLNGKDGRDGKDGVDGKDGKDGLNGKDGEEGKRGKAGKDGRDGKDGKDGIDGKDGEAGKDGSTWHLFKLVADEKIGKEGDFALVQETSNYYRKEEKAGHLVWKWKGNLKGKDGEKGDKGKDGSSTYYSGNNNSESSFSNLNPFFPKTVFQLGFVSDSESIEDFDLMDFGCVSEDQTVFEEVDLGDYDNFCEAS